MGKLCDINLQVGDVAESLMGHDSGRLYVVTAELNSDFVLVADGKYRMCDNPKQKRRKHLKFICRTDAFDSSDSAIAQLIKSVEEQNAKRR